MADADAKQTHSLDLSRLGINAVGDIAAFANGDLLLYHRPQEPGFWHMAKATKHSATRFRRKRRLTPL